MQGSTVDNRATWETYRGQPCDTSRPCLACNVCTAAYADLGCASAPDRCTCRMHPWRSCAAAGGQQRHRAGVAALPSLVEVFLCTWSSFKAGVSAARSVHGCTGCVQCSPAVARHDCSGQRRAPAACRAGAHWQGHVLCIMWQGNACTIAGHFDADHTRLCCHAYDGAQHASRAVLRGV